MKSFDMHFHQDRDRRWRVSYTLPSGSRTVPHVLTDLEREQIGNFMAGTCVAFLEALGFSVEDEGGTT